MSSSDWSWVANAFCLLGVVAGIASLARWIARARAGGDTAFATPALARIAPLALLAATVTMAIAVWRRGIEVDHFPSQTMSEVLMMFSLSLLVSMIVLRLVLDFARRSPGWAALDTTLTTLVMGGVLGTHLYANTLTTTQRDLPPALQSNWFAPHLSALIFSYSTLAIAGLVCLVWFCTRFWCGVHGGGRSLRSQLLVLAALALLPFVQVVTLPVLLATGVVFWWLKRAGRLPDTLALDEMERDLDDVSFRMFAVGMPFLTAGLWMGAFWAQEAWSNYWGWDSKENSALITWLVYVLYVHVRMLAGHRGEKAMAWLLAGALSIFVTFQLFGYLPDSQKSLHRYTDDFVAPQEGQQGMSSPHAEADE